MTRKIFDNAVVKLVIRTVGSRRYSIGFVCPTARKSINRGLRIGTSIVFLALLGGFGAHAGGAPVFKAAIRVTFWGVLAMALTAGVGAMFGAAV